MEQNARRLYVAAVPGWPPAERHISQRNMEVVTNRVLRNQPFHNTPLSMAASVVISINRDNTICRPAAWR